MQLIACADNITPHFSPDYLTSDVGTPRMRNEAIFEAPVDPIDRALHDKMISGFPFHLQTCSR